MSAIIRNKAKELLNNYTTENRHEYPKRLALAVIDCILEESEDTFWEEVKEHIKLKA